MRKVYHVSATAGAQALTLLLFGALVLAATPLHAQDKGQTEPNDHQTKEETELPGYYSLLKETGKMATVTAQKQRDAQVKRGELKPIHVGKPVADIRFPDAKGRTIGLRDYVGKKNLVLTMDRAWW